MISRNCGTWVHSNIVALKWLLNDCCWVHSNYLQQMPRMGTIVQACSLSCFKVSLWNMHSTIHWERSDAFKFFGVPRSSRGVVSAMSAIRFAGAKRCENCRSFPGSGALRDMAEGRGAECAKTAFRFRHFKVKNQPRQSEIDRADLFKSSNSLLKFSISPNVYQ